MADAKISALTELAATPAVDDVLPIVDTSVGITKKITSANLVALAGTPVKASAAEIDTGSNDAKFATAAAISGSHNVPNAVPGTTGNLMKSDGTDWVSGSPPTVPVKATGAELDTGTDDAKFSTAKALKDSKNVPSVVPGTSGNYLKSDGTDWTSVAALSIPVKATGTELDTGTDDAKFSTAKALKDSHNVPSVVPSTSGNILTSNGTDWISSIAPAGGDALMVQIFT